MLNAIGIKECKLIQRIDYSKRNKMLDSSVINKSANEIMCKIKNAKITKTLDTATNLIKSTKRLTGILIVQKNDVVVATNDIIEYKNHNYTIQTANPLEEEKVFVSFNKYYIEALG